MTIEVTRRQLMRSAGGMVLGSFALPPNLRKIIENAPASLLSSARAEAPISEIKHVVVLMQENRSFDHYFGAMPGVRGFSDPLVPKSLFYQADTAPGRTSSYLLPFHADSTTTDAEQLGTAARLVEQRGDGQFRHCAPRGRRRRRAVHHGVLPARRHPVPLGAR
jgi:phospholipase C